ncbi:ensconsin isoform X7 [Clarias gariepinus]|uniref:ensconsin isoform X7 n=1 Tax=Clarias gariepinus TaxID=13013 RepID=UPI00234D4231|nr:ensconsin isoform X7 [Clarias gariepinus]
MAEREESGVYRSSSQESDPHLRYDVKKPVSRPDSTTSGNSTYIISSSPDVHNAGRSEPLVLKLDERQRLARERREERQKQSAVREAQLMERDERARLFYEKQLEDKRRRLEEQRLKEDRRRAAVEEKRRQKLEEEKARYEAVVRRTQEKSQRVRPKQNRWSWGGTLTSSTSHNSGMRRLPLTLWESNMVSRLQTPTHSYLARSRSAVSLSGDAVTLVCPRSASCHHTCSLAFRPLQSRSSERPVRAGLSLERATKAGTETNPGRRSIPNVLPDRKDKDYMRKSWTNLSCPTPTLSLTTIKRAPSPGSQRAKVSQASSARSSTKPPQKSPASKRSRSPPPSSMPLSPSNPSLLPGNLRPSPRVSPEVEKNLKQEEEAKRDNAEDDRAEGEEAKQVQSPAKAAAEISTNKAESNGVERVASPPAVRSSTGTTDPEEASRLLAEKRRQAREQRDKEEEEKRQREEAERRHREEMARRIAEERAKREEEARRLAEEKKLKEEEERRSEEERLQRERQEEAERLQRQKEEEEARQREEAERLRQERDKHFQKEEAERLERKKRLEEIMKRTRRSDQSSGQAQSKGGASQPDSEHTVNVAPVIPSITVSAPQISLPTEHSDSNGHTNPDLDLHTLDPIDHEASTEAQFQENGIIMETPLFEEVIEVPMVTKLSRQEGDGEEADERRKTPLLAFSENGSTHDLSTWDEVQLQTSDA